MKILEMQSFCDLEHSSKSERHVAQRIGRKTLFCVPKIYKNAKVAPNLLKFWLSLLYQVIIWAKEASTYI